MTTVALIPALISGAAALIGLAGGRKVAVAGEDLRMRIGRGQDIGVVGRMTRRLP